MNFLIPLLVILAVPQGNEVDLLCVGARNLLSIPAACVPVESGALIAPHERERPVAVVSDKRRTITIDFLAPGATKMRPNEELGNVEIQLDGSPDRGWPADTVMKIHHRSRETEFRLDADLVRRLQRLRLPHGSYDLIVEVRRHFSLKRNDIVVSAKTADLGHVVLQPLPRLRVKTVDAEHAPVGGVVLSDDVAGKALATSDALGEIEWEASGQLPIRVTLASPTGALKTIRIATLTSDVDLGTIRFGDEGSLLVRVKRPPGPRGKISVRLVHSFRERDNPQDSGPRDIFRGAIGPEEDDVTIRNLEDGDYALYLWGEGPLEQRSLVVKIESEELTEEEVQIDALELEGIVTFGETPLEGAELTIGKATAPGPQWNGTLRSDEQGEFRATMWERGDMVAHISSSKSGSFTDFFKVPELASSHFLKLQIPDTSAKLRVVDAESGKPIAKLPVSHRYEGRNSGGATRYETDHEGAIEIRPLLPARHTFRVQHPDYLDHEERLSSTATDGHRDIEIRLRKGTSTYLHIVNPENRPLANATVVEDRGLTVAALRWTADAAGRVVMQLQPGTRRRVLVIPVEGSFVSAVVEARTGTDPETPQRIAVPPPTGILRIRTVSEDGAPVPDALLAFRYNGQAIPWHIRGQIERVQGVRFATASAGTVEFRNLPRGRYEFWAMGPVYEPTIFDGPFRHEPAVIDFLGVAQEIVVRAKPTR